MVRMALPIFCEWMAATPSTWYRVLLFLTSTPLCALVQDQLLRWEHLLPRTLAHKGT
jgi:hypothetical protein